MSVWVGQCVPYISVDSLYAKDKTCRVKGLPLICTLFIVP
jgi:hypothetical protein